MAKDCNKSNWNTIGQVSNFISCFRKWNRKEDKTLISSYSLVCCVSIERINDTEKKFKRMQVQLKASQKILDLDYRKINSAWGRILFTPHDHDEER